MKEKANTSVETVDEMSEDAPDRIADVEIVRTSETRVACDGGAHGHPQVWLNLGDDGRIACPYCSRVFVLAGSRHDTPGDSIPSDDGSA